MGLDRPCLAQMEIITPINRILKGPGVVIPLIFPKVPQSSLIGILRVPQEHPPPLRYHPRDPKKNPITKTGGCQGGPLLRVMFENSHHQPKEKIETPEMDVEPKIGVLPNHPF